MVAVANRSIVTICSLCGISFFLGRVSIFLGQYEFLNVPETKSFNLKAVEESSNCDALISKLQWKLNMKHARSYAGITVPLNNGYSVKCIPDATMLQMNANYNSYKLNRKDNSGLSHGEPHADENLLSVGQVGEFASTNMKLNDKG